jgi:hypothetical protein
MSMPRIAILMPQISDWERFSIRYAGLEKQLGQLGTDAVFAESHASYSLEQHDFKTVFTANRVVRPTGDKQTTLVRDLTMPKDNQHPIYEDDQAPILVHHPDFNDYLKNISNLAQDLPDIHPKTIVTDSTQIVEAAAALPGQKVVVKPVTGQESKNVFVGDKTALPELFEGGHYLVQEFINTRAGIEELAINGVHNLRLLSIGSEVVGAISRLNPDTNLDLLRDDAYGHVYAPDILPGSILAIAELVHDRLRQLPGEGQNIVAIDVMRGIDGDGEVVDKVCGVNQRPKRIGRYDVVSKAMRDPKGILWLGEEWDKREAALLAGIAYAKNHIDHQLGD